MCYNINSWVWNVSCNIGMTCVTTQTVALNCFLQHWYDLCYNTTLVWLVLQHKQLVLNCFLLQTQLGLVWYDLCYNINSCFGLNCFLQHWYDLCYNIGFENSCYNTNSWVWIVSYNIGMTCVTTQTVGLNYFLQHWDDLCYNTNSCFELFLATLGWLVLQHKQLFWNVSCNIGMTTT